MLAIIICFFLAGVCMFFLYHHHHYYYYNYCISAYHLFCNSILAFCTLRILEDAGPIGPIKIGIFLFSATAASGGWVYAYRKQ